MKNLFKTKRAKYIASFLGLLLVTVAGSTLYFFVLAKDENKTTGTIILIREKGDVSYKSEETGAYTDMASDEVEIKAGSFVKTDSDSVAHVFLPDNSMISLDQNTEISVGIDNQDVNVKQLFGNTWHRVQTVTKGDSYVVNTPTTVASVRGTKYSVNVDKENSTLIIVNESSVDVTKCKEKDKFNIEEGEWVHIAKGESECELNKGEVFSEITNNGWYERNTEIDKLYDDNEETKDKSFSDTLIGKIKDIKTNSDDTFFPGFDLDLEEPTLKITSPIDGSSTPEKTIKVEGETNPTAILKINDKDVLTDKGKFSYAVELKTGENKIKIIAMNNFTKKTVEETITITSVEKQSSSTQGAAIALTANSNSTGINLSWLVQNFTTSNGFSVVSSTQPGVTCTNGNPISLDNATLSYFYNITDGNTYYFKVYSKNANNQCETASNEISLRAPLTIAVTQKPRSNTINWTVSGTVSQEGYKILISSDQTFQNPTTVDITNSNTKTATLTAPNGAGTYYIKVCEVISNACSNNISNELTATLN